MDFSNGIPMLFQGICCMMIPDGVTSGRRCPPKMEDILKGGKTG
jgi:hypothetical protein